MTKGKAAAPKKPAPKAALRKKPDGQIITFYSFKGGCGRSMALANIAWALAASGKRVLVMDWDMEAPGLHRYLHPFLTDPLQARSPGLVDRLCEYVERSDEQPDVPLDLADFSALVQPLTLPEEAKGKLDFIGTGRQDEDYARKLAGIDWTGLYADYQGAEFFDALRQWARARYEIVLIDSRTGVADSSGVSTVQLPDKVVMCFVYNRQSIEGTASVARSIKWQAEHMGRKITLYPLPTRVEDKDAAEGARQHAADCFHGMFPGDVTRMLRIAEIRHYPWCAYGEKLAALNDDPEESGSLLRDMHALAERLVAEPVALVGLSDREKRNALWRRAAFADPRLAELKRLQENPPSEESMTQIRRWVEEATVDPELRADWAFSLARAVVDMREQQSLAGQALNFCRNFADQDPGRLGWDMANLLERYSANIQGAEALPFINEALAYYERDTRHDVVDIHLSGLMLRKSEALEAIGDTLGALNSVEAAITRVTPARWPAAELLRARLLLNKGDHDAAMAAATSLIKMPKKLLPASHISANLIASEISENRQLFDDAVAYARAARDCIEEQSDIGPFDQYLKAVLSEASALVRSQRTEEAVVALQSGENFLARQPLANDIDMAKLTARRATTLLDADKGEQAYRLALDTLPSLPSDKAPEERGLLIDVLERSKGPYVKDEEISPYVWEIFFRKLLKTAPKAPSVSELLGLFTADPTKPQDPQ